MVGPSLRPLDQAALRDTRLPRALSENTRFSNLFTLEGVPFPINPPRKRQLRAPLLSGDHILRLLATVLTATIIVLILAGQTQAESAKSSKESTTEQLYKQADKAIRNGCVYSSRWGDACPYLKNICYELVERAFAPYGTAAWAVHIVRRESGCNPGAVNSSSGTTGIAQIHPRYHTWINYYRVKRDMKYAVKTFLRLSRNGHNTGPWCLCQ